MLTLPTSCEPTSGICAGTFEELLAQAALASATTNYVIAICSSIVLTVTELVFINGSNSTLCCEGNNCGLTGSDGLTQGILHAGGDNFRLDNIVIEGGLTTAFGGAGFNSGGNLRITGRGDSLIYRSTFRSGEAEVLGGNVYYGPESASSTPGSLSVVSSTFEGGIVGQRGGGLHANTFQTIDLCIESSTFDSNSAGDDAGGVSYETFGARRLRVFDTTFAGNEANNGEGANGGIAAFFADTDPSEISIRGNTFTGNSGAMVVTVGVETQPQDYLTLSSNSASGSTSTSASYPNDLEFRITPTSETACLDLSADFP